MTILFDATRPVKTARRKPFAAGLTRTRPERTAPFTAADLAWAAANLNANTRQYQIAGYTDAHWDALAAVAEQQARVDMGAIF